MRIAILRGSPRKDGSSNLLADSFIRDAMESGHEVTDIDVAHADIRPCTGCKSCRFHGSPCVIKDAMTEIKSQILAADMQVFVTPLYYFGMSAQLKVCIDRCCSINGQVTEKHMKSALLAAAWNEDDWTMTALEIHYQSLCRYMGLEDRGVVPGTGCGTVERTWASGYPQMAYDFGRSL